ncbi:arginase family protein [Niabella aurantiaca]|uniref:arginase family protein n=1 Tax=Niabella aurantiaca TaxID=379900 RepID=UPI00037386B1|nr:arginase family protein [Niabella aurantiaca]
MSDHMNIEAFLSPVNLREIAGDERYKPDQMGSSIDIHEALFPDLELADLVLVGCGEQRGNGILGTPSAAPDLIRRQFYSLFFWHDGIRIADIGDIRQGASYTDTVAALRTVIAALIEEGKTVIILGGSHDLTMAQYGAYGLQKTIIEASVIDAVIDLDMESPFANDHFLMEMLTGEPNYIRHYNHIGFQSYLVHPGMLQTLDKLKFDFYRVGHVKEDIEQIEPAIRSSQLFSFDINAIAHAYAPANQLTPNGFNGEEACILMQYAGMSAAVNTIGIYGYDVKKDRDELTAKQIGHMLWYALDGLHRRKKEAALTDKEAFNEYQMIFSEIETTFYQSKKTGRWWMQLPGNRLVPCSYKDYLLASQDEIPDRWFRAQQR